MATLFVSHASADDPHAENLERWLRSRGFVDLFVDHSSIAGGDKWAQTLRESSGACRVVICLVTERWLASDECFAEFRAAWYMGKRIIPMLAVRDVEARLRDRLAKILAEDQGIDVTACFSGGAHFDLTSDPRAETLLDGGLRAAGALANVGIDPELFAIDKKSRPEPFPGLASFGDDDADAAVFFGRSREVADTLEALRQMRAAAERRLFVILGASGAGKSSLLRAGIIPRLRRETPAWIPLHPFRPGADPLYNFASAFARTLGDFDRVDASGALRDRLREAYRDAAADLGARATGDTLPSLVAALEREGGILRQVTGRPAATILISVDQAEELARGEGESAEVLACVLRTALRSAGWRIACTVRTDSFPELQQSPRFRDLAARGYDLRALPAFRFDDVVQRPAARYGVEVESALIDELMHDAPAEDALPLLAFTLQRLWRQYAATGRLSRAHYESVGRLTGLIEDAAERALRGMPIDDQPLSARDAGARLDALGAATFVPALAQLSESGQTVRRVAAWHSFTEEQKGLLEHFDRWRLVVRRGDETGGGTVEVAHEALFRTWNRFKSWLKPERARLEAQRSVASAAIVWDRHSRKATWLDHRGIRLIEARRLARTPQYQQQFSKVDRAYLAACVWAGLRRKFVFSAVAALALASFAAIVGAMDHELAIGGLARTAASFNQRYDDSEGRFPGSFPALKYALAALSGTTWDQRPQAHDDCADGKSLAECELRRSGLVEPIVADFSVETISGEMGLPSAVFSRDGRIILTRSLSKLHALTSASSGLFDRDAVSDNTVLVRLWDANTGSRLGVGRPPFPHLVWTDSAPKLTTAVLAPGGDVVVIGTDLGTLYVWPTEPKLQSELVTLDGQAGPIHSIGFNRDGTMLVSASGDGTACLWDVAKWTRRACLKGHGEAVLDAEFDAGGGLIATGSADGTARLWSAQTGLDIATFSPNNGAVTSVAFSPEIGSSKVLVTTAGGSASLWEGREGKEIALLRSDENSIIRQALFSPDGRRIVTVDESELRLLLDPAAGDDFLDMQSFKRVSWRLWDVAGGRPIADLKPKSLKFPKNISRRTEDIKARIDELSGSPLITFDSSGRYVVTTADDASARIWNTENGAETVGLYGHTEGILSTAFSPDATKVLTVSRDGSARLWNAGSGAEIAVFKGRGEALRTASFAPDGRRILTIGTQGALKIWEPWELTRLNGATLRDWMCSEARRKYTPDIYVFSEADVADDQQLQGRPRDVCQWRGLATLAGWRQLLNRWVYLVTGFDAYARTNLVPRAGRQ
jgi:WD40 repeat protein